MKKLIVCICFITIAVFNCKAQTLTVTLTPNDYNGFNIDCFGLHTGSISCSVSGGTAPYHYDWSNSDNTATIYDLAAGYYEVEVTDDSGHIGNASITLTQPEPLVIDEMTAYEYPDGDNISEFGACNGSITPSIIGGVLPYTYSWEPGLQTILVPTNLCADENILTVIDDNGCETRNGFNLSQPPRDDWTMRGNNGTTPGTHFIGTRDNKDFVFKTNNSERLRMKSNGDIKITAFATTGYKLVFADSLGNLKTGIGTGVNTNSVPWMTRGNNINHNVDFIGSLNNEALVFRTNNVEQMVLQPGGALQFKWYEFEPTGLFYNSAGYLDKIDFTVSTDVLRGDGTFGAVPGGGGYWTFGSNNLWSTNTGNVGIGTTSAPSQKLEIQHSAADGGIALNQTIAGSSLKSEIKFNKSGSQKWALGNDLGSNGKQTFFIWDHVNSATRLFIDEFGKVGLNTITPTKSLEIAHDESNGGMALNRLNTGNFKSQVCFQQNGTEKWTVGVDLNQNNTDNFYVWHSTSGNARLFIDNSGKLGIGNTSPSEKLEVTGTGKFTDVKVTALSGNNGKLVELDANGKLVVSSTTASNAGLWTTDALGIYNMGKVFVGLNNCSDCDDAPYKLYVEGGIMTRDVKVTAATVFPDYVFAKDYKLMSIYELEAYLQHNKHLPEIPSAKEIENNEGFELGDMQTKLLKKVEEQTLYIISLQKQIDELKETVQQVKK